MCMLMLKLYIIKFFVWDQCLSRPFSLQPHKGFKLFIQLNGPNPPNTCKKFAAGDSGKATLAFNLE